ncbi:copper chaperone PCu(A)C [Corynebacterium bovis]|uniref:Copper chaperone PCu(A)C n=1 Tax=Corynebacterium bovis TaxID=36808 RepID=A0A3R8PJH6_9CORY|nr:copper chaperone PCu(A)C [Corynebacterium bovis]MDN8578713.1 copper chaperone PCu(A)C [Corynebacterium bovis]RRO87977.1 hypothetical protein CXF48_01090 [Corynebacterium bovis]RRO89511.1 hypothetical protein CXF30_03070 [Corynebacterium bovis]
MSPKITPTRTRRSIVVAAVASTLVLGACSNSQTDSDQRVDTATTGGTTPAAAVSPSSSAGAAASTTAQAAGEEAVTLEEGYVGAKSPDTEMTAVFGELRNNSDEDVTITQVAGSIPGRFEIHEVVDGAMRPRSGGLTVPAHGTVTLRPGGDHIMVMDNRDDIAAGDAVSLTLTDSRGGTHELRDIPVRVQQSGHEDYAEGGSTSGSMAPMPSMAATSAPVAP